MPTAGDAFPFGAEGALLVFAQRASLLVWAAGPLMLAPLGKNHAPAVVPTNAAHMLHKPQHSHDGAAWLACFSLDDLIHFDSPLRLTPRRDAEAFRHGCVTTPAVERLQRKIFWILPGGSVRRLLAAWRCAKLLTVNHTTQGANKNDLESHANIVEISSQ